MYGLSTKDVKTLLEHCLTNNFLRFGKQYYHQNSGIAMGNRVAPPLAIVFMGALEERFLAAPRPQPDLYMRYIDDVLAVWTHGADKLDDYFTFLNKVHPSISFTIERTDQLGSIPFLDTLILLRQDGQYRTELYMKPMAAQIIVPFDSAQPTQLKKSVARAQFLRALRLSSDREARRRSTEKIFALFRANGYPPRLLHSLAEQAKRTFEQQNDTNSSKSSKSKPDRTFLTLPFIDDTVAKKTQAVIRSSGLPFTVAWKNDKTLKNCLVRSALEPPPCPAGKKTCRTCENGLKGQCTVKNVVYQIKCEACSEFYIGETKRWIRSRFNEHARDAKNKALNTPLGDHIRLAHPEDTPEFTVSVLRKCKDGADRKIAEALYVRGSHPTLTTQIDTWPVTNMST